VCLQSILYFDGVLQARNISFLILKLFIPSIACDIINFFKGNID